MLDYFNEQKGEFIWDANFGGRGADGGNYALVTKDGGYLSVGYTDSMVLVKTIYG